VFWWSTTQLLNCNHVWFKALQPAAGKCKYQLFVLTKKGGLGEMLKKTWEWTGYNALASREVEREQPRLEQVEVRIHSIGICGTDLHIMSGHADFSQPPLR